MDAEPGGPGKPDRRVPSPSPDVARRQQAVRGVAIGIGVAIALIGSGLLAIAVVDFATGGDGKTDPSTYPGLIGLFAAMIWWGLQLGWPELAPRPLARRLFARRTARKGLSSGQPQPAVADDDADRERMVLSLAEKEQGRVTVLEVAARCDLTSEEAKALLDDLVLRKIAQLHVSETGVLVYVFPRLLPGSGRARRRRRSR